MISPAIKRRGILMGIVCEMESFTKTDLVDEYHRVMGENNGYHNEESISDFLEDILRLGVVRIRSGKYILAQEGENRYF